MVLFGLFGEFLLSRRIRVELKFPQEASGRLVALHGASGNLELEDVLLIDYSSSDPREYQIDRLFILGRSIFLVHLPIWLDLKEKLRENQLEQERQRSVNKRKFLKASQSSRQRSFSSSLAE